MDDYAYVESIKQISLLHTEYDTNKSQGKLVAVSVNSSFSSIHSKLLYKVVTTLHQTQYLYSQAIYKIVGSLLSSIVVVLLLYHL